MENEMYDPKDLDSHSKYEPVQEKTAKKYIWVHLFYIYIHLYTLNLSSSKDIAVT